MNHLEFVTRTNLVILQIQSNHNFKKIYSTFGNQITDSSNCNFSRSGTSNFGLKLAGENIVLFIVTESIVFFGSLITTDVCVID